MFGSLAKATLNLDIVLCLCRIGHCDSIGFDSMLLSHISPDYSTLNKYPFIVRKRKEKKTKVLPKNQLSLKLP